MAAAERDSTEDWLVPQAGQESRPGGDDGTALSLALRRLDDRIEAVAASADVAGDLAERASATAGDAVRRVDAVADRAERTLAELEARERARTRRSTEAEREKQTLRNFEARADRVVLRLRELERRSLAVATNGSSGRPVS